MNLIEKTYCRIFQAGFKIAIPFMPYRQPVIIDGFANLPSIIKKEKVHKGILVTDESIMKLGLTDGLQKVLKDNNIPLFIYDKTVPNPTTQNIDEAYAIYKENDCDFIIGFGGGSSMDCAKALGVKVNAPKTPLRKKGGVLKVWKKLPLLIAVPTTAGTGSETTLAAIIRDVETKDKYAIMSFPLIPRYALLEPQVTLSLPPHITSSTGMDALTHAVEAFIGNSTTKKTRKCAKDAVRMIFQNLDTAVFNGSDEQARKNMLTASYYAGFAFTVSYVGYVHAIAHSLGGLYNVPHGLANAIILPVMLKAYGHKIDKKLKILAIEAGLATEQTPAESAAAAFIKAIEDKNESYNIGISFPEIKDEDITALAKHAAKEANPLYPVPVLWNAKELEHFYKELKPVSDGETK
ncbi:MAG: iron-containing alcohol dehydrogenase [Treponema sp.]|nr:iron-containing alcohol dehydrogenase [Treponema sp.]